MRSKTFLLMLVLLISVAIATAAPPPNNRVQFNFYDALTPVTDVDVIGFYCPDSVCSSLGIQFWGEYNTGSSDDTIVSFPVTTYVQNYGFYFGHQCYAPYEQAYANSGSYWPLQQANIPLTKVQNCRSPIVKMDLYNTGARGEPIIATVDFNLSTETRSAFTHSGPLVAMPQSYIDHYSALTNVLFQVINESGDIIYNETQQVNVLADQTAQLIFTYDADYLGMHEARVTTDVVDCQCDQATKISQTASDFFNVYNPGNLCYTSLENLTIDPSPIYVGQQFDVQLNSLSIRRVAPLSTTVDTNLSFEVFDSSDNIVYSENRTLAAGSGFITSTFSFTPSVADDYSISVTGIADSLDCAGYDNDPRSITADVTASTPSNSGSILFTVLNAVNPVDNAAVTLVSNTQLTNASGQALYTNLAPMAYNYTVTAAGYTSYSGTYSLAADENANITVSLTDIAAPVILSQNFTSITNESASLFMEYDEWAAAFVSYGDSLALSLGTLAQPLNLNHTINFNSLANDTLYYYNVTLRDQASNEATYGPFNFTTLSNADNISPVFNLVQVQNLTNESAVIYAETDENTNATLQWGLNTTYSEVPQYDTLLNLNHTFDLVNLTHNTTYYYNLTACDLAGNCNSDAGSFTTNSTPLDITPPQAVSESWNITNTTITYNLTSDELSTLTMSYGLTSDAENNTLNSALSLSHSLTADNLTSNTLYYFNITVCDASANCNTTYYNFTTLVTPDTAAPSLLDLLNTTSNDSALITFNSSEYANATLDYGITEALGTVSLSNGTFHLHNLTGLNNATLYHYNITLTDLSGNSATYGPYNFTTLAVADSIAPQVISESWTATNTTITYNLTADELSTLTLSYGLTSDAENNTLNSALGLSHSLTAENLTPNTLYYFNITVCDAFNNCNTTYSNFTTQATVIPFIPTGDHIVINEFTAQARTDWDESHTLGTNDEWVELFNPTNASINLTGWTLEMIDGSNESMALSGTINSGEYMLILDAAGSGSQDNNDGRIELRNVTGIVDSVSYGTWDDGNTSDNAPNAGSTNIYDECLARMPNSNDTDNDTLDWSKRACSFNLTNEDISLPALSNLNVSVTNETANISFSSDKFVLTNINYSADINNQNLTQSVSALGRTHNYSLTGLTDNTLYYYTLTLSDGLNNTFILENQTFTTLNNTVLDTTAPLLLNLTNVSNSDAAIISFNTDESANATLRWGDDGSLLNTAYADFNTLHLFNLTGLVNSTEYLYNITLCDASNNCALYGQYNFTTLAMPDTEAPQILTQTFTSTINSITLNLTTDEASSLSVSYGADTNYSDGTLASLLSLSHSVTALNLTDNTTYYFNITVCDAFSNCNTSYSNYTTLANIDLDAPQILNFTEINRTNESISFEWQTDELANFTLYFGENPLSMVARVNDTLSTSHHYDLTGLVNGTLYYYNISVCDSSLNCNSTGLRNFTTMYNNDTTAPSPITNLSASATNESINWTWNAPLESDVAGYNIYLNDTFMGNVTTAYYNAVNLSPNTSYTINVHSYDFNNNINTTDVTSTASTLATIDNIPPAAVSDLFVAARTNESIQWNWTNPLDSDFSHVLVYLNNISQGITTSNYWNFTGLAPNSSYTITLNTADIWNNVNYTNITDTNSTLPTVLRIRETSISNLNYNLSGTTTYLDDMANISADITNDGNMAESAVNVRLYDGLTLVSSQVISLDVNETKEISFLWTASPEDYHNLRINVEMLSGETDATDNELSTMQRVWSVDDIVSPFTRSIVFDPATNTAYVAVQNQLPYAFQDMKVTLSGNSDIIVTNPAQYQDFTSGGFVIYQWAVTNANIGETLTAVFGNDEFTVVETI